MVNILIDTRLWPPMPAPTQSGMYFCRSGAAQTAIGGHSGWDRRDAQPSAGAAS